MTPMLRDRSSKGFKTLVVPYKPAIKRSSKWPAVRRKWLKLHNSCAFCHSTVSLEVHHEVPVHIDPKQELDENNLMTLCESSKRQCHFVFGHLYDWNNYNDNIRVDAAEWSAKHWT